MNDAEQHLMTVFAVALDCASAAERDAYLERACAGEPALRARVEALLRAHDRAGAFLGRDADPAGTAGFERARDDAAASEAAAGAVVAGRYKLLERVGEGGMGEVWMAEQTEPVRRKVALKLVKPGMDSRQVVARFEAERQALALMDHPNIAKVLDGGACGSRKRRRPVRRRETEGERRVGAGKRACGWRQSILLRVVNRGIEAVSVPSRGPRRPRGDARPSEG
jgi:protein tyrosine kinase